MRILRIVVGVLLLGAWMDVAPAGGCCNGDDVQHHPGPPDSAGSGSGSGSGSSGSDAGVSDV